MHTHHTARSGLAYTTFLESLAYRPQAADDLTKGLYRYWPQDALLCKNIRPEKPYQIRWLKFDMDHEFSGADWVDSDLPRPHFVMINPANGHSHHLYGLATPVVMTEDKFKGRAAPKDLFNAVLWGYTRALGGDPRYPGTTVKTPLHPAWHTEVSDHPLYELKDLLDALPAGISTRKPDRREAVGEGRNCTLFDDLREWAYAHAASAKRSGTYDQWLQAVTQQGNRLNTFDNPLSTSEVRRMGRSITKFTWQRAERFGVSVLGGKKRSKQKSWEREKMSPEEAKDRMRQGADRTNLIRRNRTFDAITDAIGQLAQRGVTAPTKQQIADIAGVSTDTVKRYWRGMRETGGN